MASSDQIAELRLYTAEFDETSYTDEALAAIIDGATTIKAAAAVVWTQKAAKFAELVNVAESGSSRSLSDLHKNALAMAAQLSADDEKETVGVVGVRIARLTRK